MTKDPLDKLEQVLKSNTPEPSQAARDRALRVAQTNFSNIAQGSAGEQRHTSNRTDDRRGFWNGVTTMLMKMTTRNAMMATASVATIAIGFALTSQYLGDSYRGNMPLTIPPEIPAPSEDKDAKELGQASGQRSLPRNPGAVISTNTAPADSRLREQVGADEEYRADRQELSDLAAAPVVEAEPMMEAEESFAADAVSKQTPSVAQSEVGTLTRRAAEADAIILPVPEPVIQPVPESNTEAYPDSTPSSLKLVADEPVSTFSIDVDTASYAVVRSSLTQGVLPPREAVRVEEMINYFDYAYPAPESREVPFATSVSVAPTPWNADTQLLHIGIQGYDIAPEDRPPLNLVFLIDTSGSMQDANKLPLLVRSFKLLLETLNEDDTVAIVTYAGSAGMALEPTPASGKRQDPRQPRSPLCRRINCRPGRAATGLRAR